MVDEKLLKEAVVEMRRLQEEPGKAARHMDADLLLCDILRTHGWSQLVNAFHDLDKEYG